MFIDKKTLNIIKCKPQTLLELLCKNPKIRVSEIRVSACLLFSVIALCLFFYLSLSRSHGFSLNLSTEFLFQIQAATIGVFGLFWRFGFDFLEGGRRNLEDADLFVEGAGVGVRVKELLVIKKKRRFLLLSHL
jgi:hypothetical protein